MSREYRIKETRYQDGSGHFVVEIKSWLFGWTPLRVSEWVYVFFEPNSEDHILNIFDTLTEAVAFAMDHSEQGWRAFYPPKTQYDYIDLGKLP